MFLTEPEARTITSGVVRHIRALGGHVTDFGVHLDSDGFWLVATINGTKVGCRTAPGSFTHRGVAADMMACVLSPPPAEPLFPETDAAHG